MQITSATPSKVTYCACEYMDFAYQVSNDVSISSWEAALSYSRLAPALAQPCYYILTYLPSYYTWHHQTDNAPPTLTPLLREVNVARCPTLNIE